MKTTANFILKKLTFVTFRAEPEPKTCVNAGTHAKPVKVASHRAWRKQKLGQNIPHICSMRKRAARNYLMQVLGYNSLFSHWADKTVEQMEARTYEFEIVKEKLSNRREKENVVGTLLCKWCVNQNILKLSSREEGRDSLPHWTVLGSSTNAINTRDVGGRERTRLFWKPEPIPKCMLVTRILKVS